MLIHKSGVLLETVIPNLGFAATPTMRRLRWSTSHSMQNPGKYCQIHAYPEYEDCESIIRNICSMEEAPSPSSKRTQWDAGCQSALRHAECRPLGPEPSQAQFWQGSSKLSILRRKKSAHPDLRTTLVHWGFVKLPWLVSKCSVRRVDQAQNKQNRKHTDIKCGCGVPYGTWKHGVDLKRTE